MHPWLTSMNQQNTEPCQQGFLPVLRNKVSGSMVPQYDTSDDPDGRLTWTICLLTNWRWHPSPLVSPGCSWSIDPLCKRMALVFADPTSFCQLCPRKQSLSVADMWNLHNLPTFFCVSLVRASHSLLCQVKLVLPSRLRSLADTGKSAWAGHELCGVVPVF